MLTPMRILFRSLNTDSEEGTGHTHRIQLPNSVRLRSIYARGQGILPTGEPGARYRIRLYASEPEVSCWHLELKADTLGEDARTPDALHQGLEVHLPDTFWVTYQLLNASPGPGSMLHVELLVES